MTTPRSPNDSEALEEDLTNPYADGTVGLMFLEKLCLAIIRANPPTKGDRRSEAQRLREAMYALFPTYYRRDQHDADDRLLLYWMAAQWALKTNGLRALKPGPSLLGEGEPRIEFRNDRELAKAALLRFGTPPDGIRSGIKRLLTKKFADEPAQEKAAKWKRYRERFAKWAKLPEEQRKRSRVKMPPLTPRERLIVEVMSASPNPHVEDNRILQQIVDLLHAAEVRAVKPSKPTAF